MAKISRTYRLSPQTLDQIEWLGGRLGGLDATSVIRVAVAELYHRKRVEWQARLVARDDGSLDLQVSGRTLARLGRSSLDRLPQEEREKLLAVEADGLSALTLLLLGAAAGGEEVWLNPEELERLVDTGQQPPEDRCG